MKLSNIFACIGLVCAVAGVWSFFDGSPVQETTDWAQWALIYLSCGKLEVLKGE